MTLLKRTIAASALSASLALASGRGTAATITVNNGDDLQSRIDQASGGDVVLLGSGTYRGFKIEDRHFSEAQPLIIKAAAGAHPVIRGDSYEGFLAKISRTSYVVFDGLVMTHVNQPIYCADIDHFVFINLVIHDTGQEIIHIRGSSRHIDIRDCRLFDTGHTEPQWAEGIYIGMGSPPLENVEHVWIEGNEIYRTGNSEGINIKSRSYHVTIRGNKVYDIAPGTATQHNEAAISCEAVDLSFQPGVDPDIWIEDNEVYDVKYGRWANGIKVSTMGGRIVRNKIHACAQFGIAFNEYLNGPGVFTTWLHGNTITRCAAGTMNDTVLPWKEADPGANPNRPQTWYQTDAPVARTAP